MADEFKPFSVREMDTNHMYALIFGCSGSGKSFLVKRLLYDMYKDKNSYWDEFFLISPTEDLSHSFGMFNKANVKDKFDEDWINEKILEPRIRMMKGKKRMSNGKKKGQQQLPNALIIIDDCASDPGIRHSEILNKLFISGRHMGIGCMLLLQNINPNDSIPPALRNNATLVATAKPRKLKDRQFIVREWFSMGNEREGEQALQSITSESYRFAVCNLQKFANANSLHDFIYTFKADKVPKSFKLHGKRFGLNGNMMHPKREDAIYGGATGYRNKNEGQDDESKQDGWMRDVDSEMNNLSYLNWSKEEESFLKMNFI